MYPEIQSPGVAPALGTLAAVSGALACTAVRRSLARLDEPVLVRAPMPELVAGVLSAVVVLAGCEGALPAWWLPVPLLLSWFGPVLAGADLVSLRLPDALTLAAYPSFAVALAAAGVLGSDPGLGPRAFAGAVVFGGAHLAVRTLCPRAFGAGDVKLAGALGGPLGVVGPAAPILCAAGAAVITAGLSLGWRHRRHEGPAAVPHGPGLVAMCWLLVAFPGAGPPVAA